MAHATARAAARKAGTAAAIQPEITTVTTAAAPSNRPPKPYKDFPLTPHPGGHWCKKIRGRVHYFGPWGKREKKNLERLPGDGWKEALELYQQQRDDLQAGRTPRVLRGGLSVADLCNRFLTAKERKRDSGEMTARSFDEYKATTDRLVTAFGKGRLVDDLATDDFETLRADMTKRWGHHRLGNEIQKVKTVFRYGYEARLMDKPMRFGPEFKKPTARVMRVHRAKNGKKFLEASDCRKLLDKAAQPLKAMILLGLNCGMGNHDCAELPFTRDNGEKVLNLDTGWLDYPRPKTGIERRAPLWPETVTAIREAIAARPKPKEEAQADLVFLTVRGRQWLVRGIANPISVACRDLMKAVGIHREGIGFYTLRHIFETVGGSCRDQIAVDRIMGHADGSMAATYREHIDDDRLLAVTDTVRRWLWPSTEGGGQ